MSDELRGRYHRLLRWYPAAYRAERGDEIVETYLELAAPGQRRPRAADAADLLRGGLRQQLRAQDALGLLDAVPFAAQLALMTAATLAAVWLFTAELVTVPFGVTWVEPGPFATLGGVAWIAWLLAPPAALLGIGRPVVALALLTTAAVIPAAELTGYERPPLFLLVPQLALGVVALGVPARRWSPVAAAGLALTGATAGVLATHRMDLYYYSLFGVTRYAGMLLAMVVVVAGVVFAARRDPRGWWPALLLLGPALLLAMTLPVAGPQPWPTWPVAAATGTVAALIAVAAVPATVWLRGRLRPRRRPVGGCPTCGR